MFPLPAHGALSRRTSWPNLVWIRMHGVILLATFGFSVVPLVLILDPAEDARSSGLTLDPAWSVFVAIVVMVGIVAQVYGPRLALKRR